MKKAASADWADPPFHIGPASVQLDGYFIKELHCEAGDGLLAKRSKFMVGTGLHIQHSDIVRCPPVSTNIEVEFGRNKKDPSKFRVTLKVYSDAAGNDDPYMFNIQLVGYVSVDEGVNPFPGMDIFVERNAVMLLYSAAREILASVSGRGPFPAIILPTLTFDVTEKTRAAIRAEVEAKEKAIAATKQPRQLPSAPSKPSSKKSGKKKPRKGKATK